MSETTTITVHILDKAYPVKCPEKQIEALQQSALYLDKKMREAAAQCKPVKPDQVAITTALNITHELLQAKQGVSLANQAQASRLSALQQKVEEALTQQEEIAV